jgi:hypothetical protein
MRLLAGLDTRARQTVICRSALLVHYRMAKKRPDKVPPGPELDTLTAENVFGWKYVYKHDGPLVVPIKNLAPCV